MSPRVPWLSSVVSRKRHPKGCPRPCPEPKPLAQHWALRKVPADGASNITTQTKKTRPAEI